MKDSNKNTSQDSNKDENRFPNYEETVGKHPIPHAEGMAIDEDRNMERPNKRDNKSKNRNEEE